MAHAGQILRASSTVKVKWAHQLQSYANMAESVIIKHCRDPLPFDKLPSSTQEVYKLFHRSQEIVIHEAEELSCAVAKSGTIAEALLASRLILESSESLLITNLIENTTSSLSAHVDRLSIIGDIATAETLQKIF
jgi:hypothetical protein